MPRQWQWQHAGYFQLLSRVESTWYDTIVKLLLQSAAVVCFVPLLVSLVLLCSLVAALLEFATRSIAFFKLALMGFHLSWMPYTFKICVYSVYSWARGVYTLGTGLGWGCHMVIQLVGIGLFWGHSISIIVQMYHLPADRWDSQSIGSISISWSPFVFLFAFAKPCPRTI